MSSPFYAGAPDTGAEAAYRFVARYGALLRWLEVRSLAHAAHQHSFEILSQRTRELLNQDDVVRLVFRSGGVEVAGRVHAPPPGLGATLRSMASYFSTRDLIGLELDAPLTADQLAILVAVIDDAGVATEADGAEACNATLIARGVSGMRVLAPADVPEAPNVRVAVEGAGIAEVRLYIHGIRAIHHLHREGAREAVVAEVTRVVQGLADLVSVHPARALALAAPLSVLPYAVRHPVNTVILSLALGRQLGFSGAELIELGLCAAAADSGMAAIPPSIRSHPAAMGERELDVIRSHPLESAKAVLRAPSLTPAVQRRIMVCFEHHIGWDGTGYPKVLRWGRPHLFSRIVAIADAYDAMVSDTWRAGRSMEDALAELQADAGTHQDPAMVKLFSATVRQFSTALERPTSESPDG